MREPLQEWKDEELSAQLRFVVRFEHGFDNQPIDMHSRILCEAVARLLDRTDDQRTIDFAMMIRRLVALVQKYEPKAEMCKQALALLEKHGIKSHVLR